MTGKAMRGVLWCLLALTGCSGDAVQGAGSADTADATDAVPDGADAPVDSGADAGRAVSVEDTADSMSGKDAGPPDTGHEGDGSDFADATPGDSHAEDTAAADAGDSDPEDSHADDSFAGDSAQWDSEDSSLPDAEPADSAVGDALDSGSADVDDATQTDSASGTGDSGPPFEYPWEPGGACGMPPYEWLPPAAVGGLVSYESMPLYSLPASTIALLLAQLGYPGSLPIEHGTRVYRIRYVTQDRGAPVEATAMIGVPDLAVGATDPATLDTVLFLHPTVGYANACAPSAGLYGGAAAALPASFGMIAVAPDLLGLCGADAPCGGFHPYLIGEPTAIAALDAVRASSELLALLKPELNVVPSGTVAPWGGSQGGHAALFVDRYAPVYAPELDVRCVVAIVPPSNLAGQAAVAMAQVDSSTALGTAFLAAALLWYEPEGGAAAVFNASGTNDFAEQVVSVFPTTCDTGDLVKGATSAADLFAPGFLSAVTSGDLSAAPPWGCIAAANSVPTAPVPLLTDSEILFILGSADEIVDHATEIAAFETLCTQGYRMELVDCAGGSHTDTAVDTLPLQVAWVASCLAGETIPEEKACLVTPPVACTQ